MPKCCIIHYYILAQYTIILIYTYLYAKMLYNALLHFSTKLNHLNTLTVYSQNVGNLYPSFCLNVKLLSNDKYSTAKM